ncbi:WD40 repeat domain-containing protein [Streptomyces triticirhizae]|nr:WD40 repeat domain-containing protein [Streptomyces triticirhizae]
MASDVGSVSAEGSVEVLSVGVGSFDGRVVWEDLGFVRERVAEVARAFERFGIPVHTVLDASRREIDEAITSRIEPLDATTAPELLIVHLLGHGQANTDGQLRFVARDGRTVDVASWMAAAQEEAELAEGGRRFVFLVDTCEAGAATGRQSVRELGGERGVWSLGAAVSGLPTERGRFSGWVAQALHRLADTDFALDAGPLDFAQFVRELLSLTAGEHDRWRISFGFGLEQGDGDWPFLPNPRTIQLTPEQIEEQRRSLWYVPGQDLGTQIAAGSEIDDAVYFIDRASGRGLVSADSSRGFFTGRVEQLAALRAWLADETQPLLTVTGEAGSGKSGLLGVVVCAGHAQIRDRVRPLWAIADPELPEIPGIVALHARQRDPQQIVEVIADRAGLTMPEPESPEGEPEQWQEESSGHVARRWTRRSLREALERENRHRLIVIDAIDESTEPAEVFALVRSVGGAGAPCRFLLGGRREVLPPPEEFEPGEVAWVDLDAIATDTAEKDVRDYLTRLLRASEPYDTGPAAAFVELIADIAAPRLVRREEGVSAWGPFLLAGMFAHYLVTLPSPPGNRIDAEAHAERATGDLPQILERVLDTRAAEFPLLRPLLAVLARSRGDGMPLTVLCRCLAELVEDAGEISERDCQRTLREASPYLSTGIEPGSRVALYRLFHQGLVDYLRRFPHGKHAPLAAGDEERALEQTVLDGLLAEQAAEAVEGKSVDGGDGWARAEPYLLSHVLAHVWGARSGEWAERLLSDPHFLVRFDLNQDVRALDLARSPQAVDCLRLLRMSWRAHARFTSPADRAARLAFDAHRVDLQALEAQFGRLAEGLTPRDGVRALPLSWAIGGTEDHSLRQLTASGTEGVRCAAFSPDGTLFVAGTYLGSVRVWETESWQPVVALRLPVSEGCFSVAFSPDGRRLAAGTLGYGLGNVVLWDSANAWEQAGRLPGHGATAVVTFSADGGSLATGGADHTVAVWDIRGDEPTLLKRLLLREVVSGLSFHPEEPVLAIAGHKGIRLYDTATGSWLEEDASPVFTGWSSAVGFSPDGRRLVIVDDRGITHVLSTEDYRTVHEIASPGRSISGALAFSSAEARLASVSEDTIQICAFEQGTVTATLHGHQSSINDLAFSPRDPSLLVSVADDGTIRLWRVTDQEQRGQRRLLLDPRRVARSPAGGIAAVLDGEGRLALLDLVTGQQRAMVPLGTRMAPWQVDFSPDGETLAAFTRDGTLHLVRLSGQTPGVLRVNTRDGAVPLPDIPQLMATAERKFCFSPNGSRIGLQVRERASVWAITVWDIRGLRQVGRIALPERADSFEFAGPDRLAVVVGGVLAVFEVPA